MSFTSINSNLVLGKQILPSIQWSEKYRDFSAMQDDTIRALLTRDNRHSKSLIYLLENGLKYQSDAKQEEAIIDILQTPGIDRFHWYIIWHLLSNSIFKNQGKYVKRIWFFLTLLGIENQRPGGFSLLDLLHFAKIEKNNRTLAKKATEKLVELKVLEKSKLPGHSARYRIIEDTPANDYLFDISEVLSSLSDKLAVIRGVIGSKKEQNNWINYSEKRTNVGVANTNIGHIVFTNSIDSWKVDFVALWEDWISILLWGLRNKGEDLIEKFITAFHELRLNDRLQQIQSSVPETEKLKHLEIENGEELLLIDLKRMFGAMRLYDIGKYQKQEMPIHFEHFWLEPEYYFKRKQ